MKITFEKTQKEFTLFFNLLAVNKIFSEIAEQYDPDFSPPMSVLDYIIQLVGKLIVDNKFYNTNLVLDDSIMRGICSYMIGTGKFNLTDELSYFEIGYTPGDFVTIDKESLWNKIVEDGLNITFKE